VEVNYGYSHNTVSYNFGAGPLGTSANQHEITGAYTLRFPMRRITPFVQAGFGGLIFSPRNLPGVDTEGRVAFLYGGGSDFNMTRHIFVRAQYRASSSIVQSLISSITLAQIGPHTRQSRRSDWVSASNARLAIHPTAGPLSEARLSQSYARAR